MNAPAAARCCARSRVTAACSAPMAQCLVPPSKRATHRRAARVNGKEPHDGRDKTRRSPPGLLRGDQAGSARGNPRARSLAVRPRKNGINLSSQHKTACGERFLNFFEIGPASGSARTRPAFPWKIFKRLFPNCRRMTSLESIGRQTRLFMLTRSPGNRQNTAYSLAAKGLHAVCAVDALGIAGMFHTDVVIESSCRACAKRIEIGTVQGGKSLSHVRPGHAVVWYDLAYSGRAAASCCPAIAFFCSDAELQHWLSAQSPQRAGYCLTLDEALEVGRALFESVFAEANPS
jgi:hypothetical protein